MLGGVQVNVGGVQNMLGGCTNEVGGGGGGVRTPRTPPENPPVGLCYFKKNDNFNCKFVTKLTCWTKIILF